MAPSSSPPCAACKFLRRKCVPHCIFAPYFPQEESARFLNVHRVFGAGNVAKILNGVPPASRRDAAISLCFEAELYIQDPINGCLGYIQNLENQLHQLHQNIAKAKAELHDKDVLEGPVGAPGAVPPSLPMGQEPPYLHPPQMLELQDVFQGGDQPEHQRHGAHPHQQLDTTRYNEGIMNSAGGAPMVLVLAPQQFHNAVNRHPYHHDQRQN